MDRKTITAILEAAADQGWRLEQTKKGFMLYPPDKSKPGVLVHMTPSDHRAFKNMVAQLRRSGLIWPHPGKGK